MPINNDINPIAKTLHFINNHLPEIASNYLSSFNELQIRILKALVYSQIIVLGLALTAYYFEGMIIHNI